MAFEGCQEGKATPKLQEIKCPKCGADMEIFVAMQDSQAGTLAEDAVCDKCGYTIQAGTPVSENK